MMRPVTATRYSYEDVKGTGEPMKELRRSLCILAITLSMVPAPVAKAEFKCEGNACQDVKFSFENGCHVSKNNGSRKVKVQRGPYSKILSPGERWEARSLNDQCESTIIGANTANYAD
jgi:hypothetical protein